MNDLVTRARGLAECDARAGAPLGRCLDECADEIKRLTAALAEAEAERDRLRGALELICRLHGSDQSEKMADIPHVARAALRAALETGERDG